MRKITLIAPEDRLGDVPGTRRHQAIHVGVGMERGRRQAETLGAARHCRIVDRLRINAMPMVESVLDLLAEACVSDEDWDDMTGRGHQRQTGRGKAAL